MRLGNGSHSSSSRLFSLKICRRYKQVRPSDPQRLRLSTSARSLAIPSLPYMPVGAELCRSIPIRVYESHTIPITRSRTPPRAPASTCPGKKRPARPGARTPTALRRTCPQLHRGSPRPPIHGPTLPIKRTRPNLQQSPIRVTRGRRRPRRNTHTTKRRAPLNAGRTCAPDVN